MLANYEASVTSDANTLFRGNSLITKVVDEFMKKVGMAYLQRTLQSIIDEVCARVCACAHVCVCMCVRACMYAYVCTCM